MKTTVGIYEAKTHFSRLIERVRDGERIVISRNGVAVAELCPVIDERMTSAEEAKAKARAIRAASVDRLGKAWKSGKTLRELAHEGHRYK